MRTFGTAVWIRESRKRYAIIEACSLVVSALFKAVKHQKVTSFERPAHLNMHIFSTPPALYTGTPYGRNRYTHDARRFVVEAEEAQEKLNGVQNSIFGANEEMDRFKLQMNWNQEELEQWALAAKQKEEDNLALQKYARADDVKIKDLR